MHCSGNCRHWEAEQSRIVIAKTDQIRPVIRYPAAGALIALDPDIPPERQRIRFTAQGVTQAAWLLNGKAINARNQTALTADWMPWPGKQLLQLVNHRGMVLDQVSFEVRGAMLKPEVHATRL